MFSECQISCRQQLHTGWQMASKQCLCKPLNSRDDGLETLHTGSITIHAHTSTHSKPARKKTMKSLAYIMRCYGHAFWTCPKVTGLTTHTFNSCTSQAVWWVTMFLLWSFVTWGMKKTMHCRARSVCPPYLHLVVWYQLNTCRSILRTCVQ